MIVKYETYVSICNVHIVYSLYDKDTNLIKLPFMQF